MELKGLRVTTSAAVKEKRLAALLGGRDPAAVDGLAAAVEDAQLVGSLELAGESVTLDDVRAARQGGGTEAARRLLTALRAVPPEAPFEVETLVRWHAALCPGTGFRTREQPDAPASSPPSFIESRLAIVEQWLSADSRRQLKPAQAGALVLARIQEILPWDEGNGRVARLAASHLMVQMGARRPILVGSDATRLREATLAAFQLHTEPLASLLDEADGRVVDVIIRALE
jgi:Fic/DOC family protein